MRDVATRCNLIVEDSYDRIQLYRHWDGYLGGAGGEAPGFCTDRSAILFHYGQSVAAHVEGSSMREKENRYPREERRPPL
jgi:hypothetical protein